MLKVTNLKVNLAENGVSILKGVNLTVNPGEIHLINGRNGSGKSTFVNSIMANPNFEVTDGKIELLGESYNNFIVESLPENKIHKNIDNTYNIDVTELEPNERSLAGLYLASQYPTEIPGVSLTNYLRLIYNIRRPKEEQLPVFKFKQLLEQKASIIDYPRALLERNLNEGFSGGEKKKTEILQMLILEPKYVLLDEVDSGLDKESIKDVFGGIKTIIEEYKQMSFLIITHYEMVLDYLKPDFVHNMKGGQLD